MPPRVDARVISPSLRRELITRRGAAKWRARAMFDARAHKASDDGDALDDDVTAQECAARAREA